MNCRIEVWSPSTSTRTPVELLSTLPLSYRLSASEKMKGRKPTP